MLITQLFFQLNIILIFQYQFQGNGFYSIVCLQCYVFVNFLSISKYYCIYSSEIFKFIIVIQFLVSKSFAMPFIVYIFA